MVSSEGNQLFAGDFRANLNEETLIWFNLQRDGTGNEFSNIKNTFTESLQLQMSVLHQRYVHLQGWLWWSLKLSDGWEKYKEKIPNVSYSNQNVEKKMQFQTQVYRD